MAKGNWGAYVARRGPGFRAAGRARAGPLDAPDRDDPRYRPGAEADDIITLGVFKGVEEKTVDVYDAYDGTTFKANAEFTTEYMDNSKVVGRTNIRIKDLTATQDEYFLDNMRSLRSASKRVQNEPIDVFQFDGKNYVMDGTHRVILAASKGRTTIRATIHRPKSEG